ncbi:MAG: TolC family outer membrane protein [Caulobacterales bacterium]
MLTTRRAGLAAAVCGAAVLTMLTVGDAAAESLPDAIALAYGTNPTLQAERAQLRVIDEEYAQARAGLAPSVNATYTIDRDYNQQIASLGGPPLDANNASITITQPLYTGGRVTSAISAADADILAGREALRSTEIGVLQSVIQAYLDVRRDQEQLAITQDNNAVLNRQLEETKARFDVGEVTRTDVAQAQARLAIADSQRASALSTLAIARAAYAAVVGQNPGELAPEPPISKLLPATVDQAFDAAERDNPQIRQADYAEQASAARVAQAKAATRPTIGAQATLGYAGGGVNSVTGKLNPFGDYSRDITIAAQVSVPLFSGGLTSSNVRQAAERDNVTRIGIETARRQVLQAVSQSWNQLLGARANLLSNEEQVKAQTIAFEGVRQEAQVGLRTTLDVLNAQQELESAELSLVGARHDEYLASAAVLAAMGQLEARNLVPDTPRYDPKANYEHVRHSLGWTPWEPAAQAIDRLGAPSVSVRPPASPVGEVVRP